MSSITKEKDAYFLRDGGCGCCSESKYHGYADTYDITPADLDDLEAGLHEQLVLVAELRTKLSSTGVSVDE